MEKMPKESMENLCNISKPNQTCASQQAIFSTCFKRVYSSTTKITLVTLCCSGMLSHDLLFH